MTLELFEEVSGDNPRIGELLDEVKEIAWDFLEEQGGFTNGHSTWVEGTVGGFGRLEWSTPDKDQLTIRGYRRLGDELEENIKEHLREHHPEFHEALDNRYGPRINFTKENIEHGCFKTIVEIVFRSRMSFHVLDKDN